MSRLFRFFDMFSALQLPGDVEETTNLPEGPRQTISTSRQVELSRRGQPRSQEHRIMRVRYSRAVQLLGCVNQKGRQE